MTKEQAKREKQWELERDARVIEEYAELCAQEKRFNSASEYLTKKQAATAAALVNASANIFLRGVKGNG